MQFRKMIEEEGQKYRVEVNAKLKRASENYFSITYSLYKENGILISCGSNEKTIHKYFPELDDISALHLSDENGIPMYALENGFFYLQNPNDFDDNVIAGHFRISLDQVKTLQLMSKDKLSEWVESQKPRWKSEADYIKSKYDLTND